MPGRHIPLVAVRDAAAADLRRGGPHAADSRRAARWVARSTGLNGAELYLKLEVLQPIGSFKIRGALQRRPPAAAEQLQQGVWTVSAGNAAQGVAFAARKAGARCSVMVMDTAPDTKIRAIERLGASIVRATYDECWRTVEAHGSDRMTGHFVHPFDDDRFIAGNATAGLEILEDLPDVDAIVAPLGGGGLLAGIAAAVARAEARHAHLRRRAGNRGAAVGVARRGAADLFRQLAGVVRRRRRRQVGAADDVAAAVAARRARSSSRSTKWRGR